MPPPKHASVSSRDTRFRASASHVQNVPRLLLSNRVRTFCSNGSPERSLTCSMSLRICAFMPGGTSRRLNCRRTLCPSYVPGHASARRANSLNGAERVCGNGGSRRGTTTRRSSALPAFAAPELLRVRQNSWPLSGNAHGTAASAVFPCRQCSIPSRGEFDMAYCSRSASHT